MENLVNKIFKIGIEDIKSYNFPLDELFGLKVNYNGILYCFIIKFSSHNPNLICFGPGAHQRNSTKTSGESIFPPYFDRWSWHQYLDESFIAYADPMFFYDDEVVLSWFVGDKNQWYLETVSLIIKELLLNHGILPENTLFFGSSGGGFASVCLGTLIKGSKVMVNNAQFFVLNFDSPKNVLEKLFSLLEKNFLLPKEKIIPKIIHRLSVIELFKKENYVPEITYYINAESKYDFTTQTLPFIKEIQKLDFANNNLNIQFYHERKNDPHNPMPFNKTINSIKKCFSSENYLKVRNIYFNYPKNYKVDANNTSKISDGTNTINFVVHSNSDVKKIVNKYKILKQRTNFSITLSKLKIDNFIVFKSVIITDETNMHFWFEFRKDVYEIYTWNGDANIELIIRNLIKSAKPLN